MKKLISLAGLLLCAGLILGLSSGRVFARLTGTDPGTDVWCNGVSGSEACVEGDGDFVPTTTEVQDLGTSSLYWDNAYIKTITTGSGGVTTTGNGSFVDLAATGNTTLGNAASDTLTVNGSTIIIAGTGAAAQVDIATGTSTGATSILHLDGVNKRVGINKRAPTTALDVSGTVTATGVAAGSTGITNTGPTQLAVATTAQLVLRSDAVGSTFLVQEFVAGALVSNAYNLCTSTAANIASYVYVAVSTGDAAAQSKNGQACAY